ncbi:MAG TPA: HemK2/MTQ2 family protein methyltransferase [Candidatus Nanoarchaeia archaeon]|nr:HemK2/MTQ2 family protein methyltransferase [Candidatus Nanoarchaeia archaeon]
MIYEPREDSLLLEKYVRAFARGKVLDMGTGSGILAMAAKSKTPDVTAVDVNEEAVKYAKRKGINAFVSDLFEKVEGKFDVITFNPPYLPQEKDEVKEDAQMLSGGKKGNEVIKKFLSQARKHLEENGIILMAYCSLTPDVEKIAEKDGFEVEVLEKQKYFFEELITSLLRVKG